MTPTLPQTDNTIGPVEPWWQQWFMACRRHVGAPPGFWREMGAMGFVLAMVLAIAHIGEPISGMAFLIILFGIFLRPAP